MIAMCEGDAMSAIALYQEALARHRAGDDPVGTHGYLALIRCRLAYSFCAELGAAISRLQDDDCPIALSRQPHRREGWHRAYMMMELRCGGLAQAGDADADASAKLRDARTET
ncbi:hypothetical protein GCM10020219_055120 [Nonomuraea dietziae]